MKIPHTDLHRLLVGLVIQQGGRVSLPMDDLMSQDMLKNDLDIRTDSLSRQITVKVVPK